MHLKDLMNKIESSNEFKDWKKQHPKAYLAHFFIMLDNQNNGVWQTGYYLPDKDTVVTIIVEGDKVSIADPDKVFKKPGDTVQKVEMKDMKIDFDQALELAKKTQQEHYSAHLPVKTIAVLQNLKEEGEIWNITYVTQSFNSVNIKIDIKTGEVITHKLTSIMSFDKG